MLIQKPLDAGDIVSIKLTNGDEIIAKLLSQDATSCTLGKPVVVAIQPASPTQVSLGFMPFMVSTEDETSIVLAHSTMLTKPVRTRTDVANNYRRATSNIALASAADSGLFRP